MRKSTARKLLEAESQAQSQLQKRRTTWRTTIMAILLLVAIDAGFIGFMRVSTAQSAAVAQAQHQQQMIAMQKNIDTTKKKVADAKRQEAEARKKQEETLAKEAAAKKTQPAGTTATTTCDVTNPDAITVVVNKKHCIKPSRWAPSDLTLLSGYQLRNVAATHLQAMMDAAAAAGLPFGLTSAYRSYDSQVVTYNNWVAVNGSQAAADTVSARPGFSEHQTGLAADLKTDGCVLECFAGTAQYTWLTQHAAEYGFIERYPPNLTAITGYSPEAWHWRYVGKEVATAMKTRGIQTLETYFGISGGDYAS